MKDYTYKYRGHEHMMRMAEAHKRVCEANKLTFCITCPKCGKLFEVQCTQAAYDKGRHRKYCSRSCANSHARTEESKKKVSDSLRKLYESRPTKNHHSEGYRQFYERVCIVCGKIFYTSHKLAECCSRQCTSNKPGYRENLRKKALERIANGTHNGWNSRNISSYAEQFWVKVLDNNNIRYTREYHLDKYFLDFYIVIGERKIDLEIDGRQHKRQVEHDNIRDAYIKSQGIEVYRIEWNCINTESGKNKMKAKIDAFLKYIKS